MHVIDPMAAKLGVHLLALPVHHASLGRYHMSDVFQYYTAAKLIVHLLIVTLAVPAAASCQAGTCRRWLSAGNVWCIKQTSDFTTQNNSLRYLS
jgi:hypothetical protein